MSSLIINFIMLTLLSQIVDARSHFLSVQVFESSNNVFKELYKFIWKEGLQENIKLESLNCRSAQQLSLPCPTILVRDESLGFLKRIDGSLDFDIIIKYLQQEYSITYNIKLQRTHQGLYDVQRLSEPNRVLSEYKMRRIYRSSKQTKFGDAVDPQVAEDEALIISDEKDFGKINDNFLNRTKTLELSKLMEESRALNKYQNEQYKQDERMKRLQDGLYKRQGGKRSNDRDAVGLKIIDRLNRINNEKFLHVSDQTINQSPNLDQRQVEEQFTKENENNKKISEIKMQVKGNQFGIKEWILVWIVSMGVLTYTIFKVLSVRYRKRLAVQPKIEEAQKLTQENFADSQLLIFKN